MSNRRKRKGSGPDQYLVMTEANKNEISEYLGYPLADCDLWLVTAKLKGYKGVRFGPFPAESLKDPRFISIKEMEVENA